MMGCGIYHTPSTINRLYLVMKGNTMEMEPDNITDTQLKSWLVNNGYTTFDALLAMISMLVTDDYHIRDFQTDVWETETLESPTLVPNYVPHYNPGVTDIIHVRDSNGKVIATKYIRHTSVLDRLKANGVRFSFIPID